MYRVKLPGNPVFGEGKPENQNHAMMFTRGEHIQAIDMNQEGWVRRISYFENILKDLDLINALVFFAQHNVRSVSSWEEEK